jgi:hypothetical protein
LLSAPSEDQAFAMAFARQGRAELLDARIHEFQIPD